VTIPNRRMGVTTVDEVRRFGGDVVPSPTATPFHCILCGITPKRAEELFTPLLLHLAEAHRELLVRKGLMGSALDDLRHLVTEFEVVAERAPSGRLDHMGVRKDLDVGSRELTENRACARRHQPLSLWKRPRGAGGVDRGQAPARLTLQPDTGPTRRVDYAEPGRRRARRVTTDRTPSPSPSAPHPHHPRICRTRPDSPWLPSSATRSTPRCPAHWPTTLPGSRMTYPGT
jgi:hypothetical protein